VTCRPRPDGHRGLPGGRGEPALLLPLAAGLANGRGGRPRRRGWGPWQELSPGKRRHRWPSFASGLSSGRSWTSTPQTEERIAWC